MYNVLANFYNKDEPLQKIEGAVGQVNGAKEADFEEEDIYFTDPSDEDCTTDYAQKYQKKEQQLFKLANQIKEENKCTLEDDISSMATLTDIDSLKQEELMGVFSKFNFNKQQVQELTIDFYKEQILNLTTTNEVVLIEGPTGCGKTTRVPQFILDNCRAMNKACKIVVTQPRRLAAISIARRVCDERGWDMGTICGYKVGLESTVSHDTLLSYVTTGVLLQKLIKQKNLLGFTHIIIDEVHERNKDMDFLLLIIRRFMNTNLSGTKVILMSATFDSNQFAHYFRRHYSTGVAVPPSIQIRENNKFHIQHFYLDQLNILGEIPTLNVNEPTITKTMYSLFVKLVRAFDKLDPKDPVTDKRIIGNVLVFLPGIFEIEEAYNWLSSSRHQFQNKAEIGWHIVPLHSSITIEEQRKVFHPPPPGKRKIILSTNIAESSITVPDIFFVVDFCLTKTMEMDLDTQYQSLKLQWASHDNCIQRAGRVGRVGDGRVYYLVHKYFYQQSMPKNIVPEILRAPLNQTVLLAKMLELNEPPKAVLALAMNPPNLRNIDKTVMFLKEIGALGMTTNGEDVLDNGDLTFLGEVMAHLPLDIHLSKLIVLGYMFNCLEECIIMATGSSLTIFRCPFKEHLKAYRNLLQWADGSSSDLIAYLNLYKVWQQQRRMHDKPRQEKEWAAKNFVSPKNLIEWQQLIREVKDRLNNFNIKQSEGTDCCALDPTELPTVIKVVICGAFYPNYFTRSTNRGQVDEREAVKILGGRDPNNTVYFTGFDMNQPGPLYTKSIKKLLSDCGNMRVSFDNSSKVYVEFLNQNPIEPIEVNGSKFVTSMPGKVQFEVYHAVKMRQLTLSHSIQSLSKDEAWKYAKELGIDQLCLMGGHVPLPQPFASPKLPEDRMDVDPPILPGLDTEFISISISMIIDAGHFWACNVDDFTRITLNVLEKVLNVNKLRPVEQHNVIVGGLYAALFYEDHKYYRAKVVGLVPHGPQRATHAQILFIDYGNTATVKVEELRALPDHKVILKPALAMECFMSGIQPSVVLEPRALWTKAAKLEVEKKVYNKVVFGKVYSVVNGIVHLELYEGSNNNEMNYTYTNSINALLIEKGFAQPAEESFLSKENHLKRQMLIENPEKRSMFEEEREAPLRDSLQDIDIPDGLSYRYFINLKGPYSPLEMRIYPISASGVNKNVTIEATSVNTILLDTDPQDPHERLIVAANIGQRASGDTIVLRHTTIMPNIHGFVALAALMFSPKMEPKPTDDGAQIGAILFGLGALDNSHRPLYGQHDICLHLDTEISAADINEINTLRHYMNISINVMYSNCKGIPIDCSITNCQKELISRLFKLLKTNRKSVDRVYIKHAEIWGKSLFSGTLLTAENSNYRNLTTTIWPLHWTMHTDFEAKRNRMLELHLKELDDFAKKRTTANQITCQFCNLTMYSTQEVRVHMIAQNHQAAIIVQKQINSRADS